MFLDWLSTRVWIHENWRASIRVKLHHCQRAKKWWTWRVISIIAENKPHADYETYFHLIKIYDSWPDSLTIEVLLRKIFRFFDHWSIHLFQSNQLFQAIDSWTDPLRKRSTSFALKFPKLSSQNMYGALNMSSVTSRFLSPVSTVSARNAWDHDPFWWAHTKKKGEEERNTCIFRVSVAFKQARLITSFFLRKYVIIIRAELS